MSDLRESIEIVIPVRAAVPWLRHALESIASQIFQPSYVTVVDDGAEAIEGIQALGNRLFGDRFQLVKSSGAGISNALNTAIEASRAHWIARMDADDVAHPNRLSKQLDYLSAHCGHIIGCGTQVRFINSTGKVLGRSHLPTVWSEIKEKIQSRTCFVHSSMVIRRDALLATPYRPSMDGAEDVDLILRLAEKGPVVNLNDALLDYRLHLTQESFRTRARHTAVQELAFRLAWSRRRKHFDPLEIDPLLAEKFIDWRLSVPGYIRSRTFLTALRYMRTHLSGCDLNGSWHCFWVALRSLPPLPGSIFISWRVFRRAAAALLDQPTPFPSLNLN
jgi:glycosyltransferase involved in cell wall biosynthesis